MPACQISWKMLVEDIACTKQNGQIYIAFTWFALLICNFELRVKRSIKGKDHKSDNTLDFLTLVCYALECHGQLQTLEKKNREKYTK